MKSYDDSEQIIILSPIDHIRRRPSMYFGGKDHYGLHNYLFTIVDLAIDQSIKKSCDAITVTLRDDAIAVVSDNGIGMPVEKVNETEFLTEFELTSVGMGRGGNYFTSDYHTLYSLPVSCSNHVSAEFHVEIKREGYLWGQSYKEGIPQTEFRQIRPLAPDEATGSTVTFRPDFTVFDENEFDFRYISNRMNGVACCIPGLSINVSDERSNHQKQALSFHYPDGVAGFVQHINRDFETLHKPIVFSKMMHLTGFDNLPITVDVAIQYVDSSQPTIVTYINGKYFSKRSKHEDTLIKNIEAVFNPHETWNASGFTHHFIKTEDVLSGLSAVVSIWHIELRFDNALGSKLISPEPAALIREGLPEALETFRETQPEQFQRIIDHIEAQMQQRENRRRLI